MTTETESVNEILSAMKAASMQCADFATRIQAAHAREVGTDTYLRIALREVTDKLSASSAELASLRMANIAYSSDNANLLGRAMAAEKDAGRYRWYRATTWKPIFFGDDGWSEEDTDAAIDAAMSPRVEVIR